MEEFAKDKFDALNEINFNDMVNSFGWKNSRLGMAAAGLIFRGAARAFTRQVLDYDAGVSAGGLAAGSQRILPHLASKVIVEGQEHIPTIGPLIILSNHPGLADTIALFANIPREDLFVLAAARPFLGMLEATSRRLIAIPDGSEGRLGALRQTADHLRKGGAILTFPAGKIEPDPAVMPGAVESLANWNSSTGLFARMVPGLIIVPAIVSGVIARQAVYHPLTHLRKKQLDREGMGASLQLIMDELLPNLWPVTVRVRFAPPIHSSEVSSLRDPTLITQALIERIRPFLENVIGSDKRF